MTKKTTSLLVLSIILFTACSSQPTISSSQLKDRLIQSEIRVLPLNKPIALAERTKAQAIGKMIVSSVAASAIGSTGSGGPQQFQNNIQIGQSFGQQLQQALPDSYKVNSGNGIDLALAKKLDDFFIGLNASTPPKNQIFHIGVSPLLWELGYVSLLTSADYQLNYSFQISVLEKENEKYKPIKGITCAGSAPNKLPLDDWKSDDYKLVNNAANEIVDQCVNKFLSALELQ